MKCKIFSGKYYSDLEIEINDWLLTYKTIRIAFVVQSVDNGCDESTLLVITIFYYC
jgi:hypothetical protein